MREGDRFEGYLLKNKLGEGGMAEVFRAERVGDHGVTREVCIKRILPSLSTDAVFVEMFIDEARIASTLRHGNIVAVEQFGRHEGVPFMAMTWVHGVDAVKLMRRLQGQQQRMPIDAALHIIDRVLRALEYAHGKVDERGRPLEIVHRDVSPHNILISFSAEVLLSDFGIAKATSRLHQTHGHVVKGKVAYMAPEQAVGAPLDHRADLFAVGVVAYQLLTGTLPFGNGSDPLATTQALIHGNRARLSALRPDVPVEVEAIIDRLLQVTPDDRYDDAAAVHDALSTMPALLTGERTLQRLVRTLFGEEVFSTISPAWKHPGPSVVTAVDAHPFGAVSQHAFDGTLPALTTDPVTDEAVTRIVAGPTRRAAPVRPQPRARALPTATDDAPTDPAGVGATGPFVAVSIVPPRPRSKMRLVSVVALGCVVALAGVYLAVKVSDEGAHTASAPPITAPPITAPPSAPRPAPVAPQTPTAPGGTSERLKIDEVAQLDAGSTADAAAPPLALGTVSILAVPWGTVSVDGQPPRDSGAIFHLPAGRHRVRAVIQSRYVVTRTVTIHVGANPNVRLDAPVDYAM